MKCVRGGMLMVSWAGRDMELDVVGLLETDLHVSVCTGRGDRVDRLTTWLCQRIPFGTRDL